MEALIAVGVLIGMCVQTLSAYEFDKIAHEKGYDGYFWYCLLVPFWGNLMVVALPDKKGRDQIASAITFSQQIQQSQYQYYYPQQMYWKNNGQ